MTPTPVPVIRFSSAVVFRRLLLAGACFAALLTVNCRAAPAQRPASGTAERLLAALEAGRAYEQAHPAKTGRFADDIRALLEREKTDPVAPGGILFVGSSIFRMWTDVRADMAPLPVRNHAFGGSRTSDQLERFDLLVAPAQPKVVVYYCGSNDINGDEPPEAIFARVQAFTQKLRSTSPAARFVYVAIFRAPQKRNHWQEVDAANGLIRDYCAQEGFTFVDLNPVVVERDGTPRAGFYREDQLHYQRPAYVAMTALLKPVVEQVWREAAPSLVVAAAAKPTSEWRPMPTRTLAELPEVRQAPPDGGLDRFGGLKERRADATGFFHVAQRDGRWWLVDPDGGLFFNRSVVGVRMSGTPGGSAALRERFKDAGGWAAATTQMLRETGFNGTGAWSDQATLAAPPARVAYTPIWNFMSSYGKKRGGTYQRAGNTGYPNQAIFVFDPQFEKFCEEHARQLAATKDDPWLLGHFTDNELPFRRSALEDFLTLPAGEPGQQAAAAWLKGRHGPAATAAAITEADRDDFLAHVVDRYFALVTAAIRRHDPHHLVIGSRFHAEAVRLPAVFRAAGRHLDVVSINYYHAWTPDPQLLAMWERESGRPFLVTEWYAKGMDAPNLANVSGAGWVVKTQADRGRFYQNFALGLLAAKGCVGWHWFRYMDNDPDDRTADPSNRDSNKGVVSNRYEPYPALLSAMRELNERAYRLIDHFDGPAAPVQSGGR